MATVMSTAAATGSTATNNLMVLSGRALVMNIGQVLT